jgi:SAM-dependent methyltransferase
MSEPVENALAHYYEGVYWNVFAEGMRQLNVRASGDPGRSFLDRFFDLVDGRVFDRALILNCGSGWFEHHLFEHGAVRSTLGVDWSEDLLTEAKREAEQRGIAAEYLSADINEFEPPADIDLVVNYAAGHHIRYLDRVLRRCCRALGDDGVFLTWDYVGPHRNQYPWIMWDAAWQANAELPPEYQSPMIYPHLPTMLSVDPTEAIHAELYETTFARYFEPIEQRAIGGGVAYLVLAENQALFDAPREVQDPLVARIFERDAAFTAAHPDHNLFTFSVARPRPATLKDGPSLRRWTEIEDEREAAADANQGLYYPPTTLQQMTERWADDRIAADHRLAFAHQVQAHAKEVEDDLLGLAARFPNKQLAAFNRTKSGQLARRAAGKLNRAVRGRR